MSTPSTTREPASILVGFDGSEESRLAVSWAAAEAASSGRPLSIVFSFQWAPPVMGAWTTAMAANGARIRARMEKQLEEVAREHESVMGDLPIRTSLTEGPAGDVLTEVAERTATPILVVGASGLGALPRAFLGSTSAEVVRTVRRPVVVVRGRGTVVSDRGPVVVGVDGSSHSERAVGFAFDFADRHGLAVRAVHAWSDWPLGLLSTVADGNTGEETVPPLSADHAEKQVYEIARRYPRVHLDWDCVPDRAVPALLERAEGASLLVVGSRGHGVLKRAVLGSVSHALLYQAPGPLAVLRQR